MWMLGVWIWEGCDPQVCRDKGSSANVAYVGINYFDRYLSCKVIPRQKLELLSWFCLHLASLYYDNRTNNLSYVRFVFGVHLQKEISSVISDTYSPQEIRSFLFDLLSVLDFRLSPYSPYTEGETILYNAGHSSLYSNYQSLLNGVCLSSRLCFAVSDRIRVSPSPSHRNHADLHLSGMVVFVPWEKARRITGVLLQCVSEGQGNGGVDSARAVSDDVRYMRCCSRSSWRESTVLRYQSDLGGELKESTVNVSSFMECL